MIVETPDADAADSLRERSSVPLPRPLRRLRDVPLTDTVALIVCVAPILVAVGRAVTADWRPVYDSAYFTARSLDVFGNHHPFVGAWSTFAAALGDQVNNLGPMQLLLLAPFTKVHPYVGTALGTGLINALCVIAVWRVARLLFGARGVAATMAATAMIAMSFGAPALVDARQQHGLILPFWALLWLTTALTMGRIGAALPWVFAASLVLQTHFSYAYLGALMAAIGAGAMVTVVVRRRERASIVHLASALLFAVVLWAHTLWDQFFLTGNLGRVLRHASGEHPAGINTGVQILADSPLGYPFWWPGSVKGFGAPWSFAPGLAWLIVLSWLALLAAGAGFALARRNARDLVLAGIASFTLAVAAVAAAQIPPSGFRSLPQTYFWLWPVAAYVVIAVVACLAPLLPRLDHSAELAVGCATVAALLALPNRYTFPAWQIDDLESAAGRPLLDQIRPSLAAIDFDIGPAIVVDSPEFRLLAPDYYNIIAEMTRSGLDVHFPAGSDDLQRFGVERCETGEERWRLAIILGSQRPALSRLDIPLARTDGPPSSIAREFGELNERVLELVRDGEIEIDRSALGDAGFAGSGMLGVLDAPEDAHPDLWYYLFPLLQAGSAAAHPQHRAALDRWTVLARANIAGHMLVYLTPNYFPTTEGCA